MGCAFRAAQGAKRILLVMWHREFVIMRCVNRAMNYFSMCVIGMQLPQALVSLLLHTWTYSGDTVGRVSLFLHTWTITPARRDAAFMIRHLAHVEQHAEPIS